jgi:peptide/nickel transport system ATP-binding protein
MALLKLDNVSVSVGGETLLDGVSFSIGKGQRLGLIGAAGSGKSLLLRAVLGLLPRGARSTGSISFDDRPMPSTEAELAALRGRRIGAIPANAGASLDPLATIGAQLAAILPDRADASGRVDGLLREVGLDPKLATRYPARLSLAERRLVACAMGLAGQPDLLLADDPVAGLDLIDQRRVLDLVQKHVTERNMSTLLVSHDLKAVAMLSTKIVVLRAGKVVESGEKAEIFGHPKHEFTRAILSAGRHRARTLMRTPIGDVLLDVRNVSRRYRQPDRSLFEPRPPLVALDGASFAVRAGESVGIVGPSGSGKSTLARIIAGLERVSDGQVEFENVMHFGSDMPRILRRDISLVLRDPAPTFNAQHTVGEAIAEPLQLELQKSHDELGGRMVEVVNAVGLHADALTRRPGEFSTGELQRLSIARALVTRPRLIVLDEPVAGLDVGARGEVLVLLNRLRADFGLSFLVIGHDLDLMRVVADRVLVMQRGRIVETGTPVQLLDKPQHPLTQQLVAAQLPEIGIVPVF